MNPLHVSLWNHIKRVTPPEQLPWCHVEHMCAECVHQWHVSSTSLRLTQVGVTFLKKVFNYYSFPMPAAVVNWLQQPWILLGLHRHMKTPYHVDNRYMTVFDQEVAMEIEICGRDLNHWAQSFLK